jgi:hypothetical protein
MILKLWEKSRSLAISSVITKLMFLILLVLTFTLPQILNIYIDVSNKLPEIYMPLLTTLYLSLVPAFICIILLNSLLKNISKDIVFEDKNVLILRNLSWCCIAVSLIFLFFAFYYILGILITIVAFFFGLIIRVIKNVFVEAIKIKQENDWTV